MPKPEKSDKLFIKQTQQKYDCLLEILAGNTSRAKELFALYSERVINSKIKYRELNHHRMLDYFVYAFLIMLVKNQIDKAFRKYISGIESAEKILPTKENVLLILDLQQSIFYFLTKTYEDHQFALWISLGMKILCENRQDIVRNRTLDQYLINQITHYQTLISQSINQGCLENALLFTEISKQLIASIKTDTIKSSTNHEMIEVQKNIDTYFKQNTQNAVASYSFVYEQLAACEQDASHLLEKIEYYLTEHINKLIPYPQASFIMLLNRYLTKTGVKIHYDETLTASINDKSLFFATEVSENPNSMLISNIVDRAAERWMAEERQRLEEMDKIFAIWIQKTFDFNLQNAAQERTEAVTVNGVQIQFEVFTEILNALLNKLGISFEMNENNECECTTATISFDFFKKTLETIGKNQVTEEINARSAALPQ